MVCVDGLCGVMLGGVVGECVRRCYSAVLVSRMVSYFVIVCGAVVSCAVLCFGMVCCVSVCWWRTRSPLSQSRSGE